MTSSRSSLGLASALFFTGALAVTAACSAPAAGEGLGQSEDDLTSAWFAANAPPGSAEEKAILALVNDRSMSPDEYVDTCDFSLAASAAIVDWRQGDEPADTSDDRSFDSLATLDNLPFTDRPFWAAALSCAKAHYLPDGNSGGTCATGTSTVQQSPLAMEFVLDGSGSMSGKKWEAATVALSEIFSSQAAKNDPKIGVGLRVFPADSKPRIVSVESLDATHLGRLNQVLQSNMPGGGTPLYEAVIESYDYLENLQPTGALASATKVVVLLTDGVPDNKGNELLTFVTDHSSNAQLFALGIGALGASKGDYDPAYVGQLAVAGRTRASSTCNPTETTDESKMCHFQVTPGAKPAAQIKDELLAAVEKVRTNIAACDIGLQHLGTGSLDASSVTVTVRKSDGTETTVPKHATYGWSLDDATAPTKVLLRGKACDDLRSAPSAVARVEIACK